MSGVLTAKAAVTGSVGAASAVLVGENRSRRLLRVTNTHATQTLQINLSTSAGVAPTAVAGSSHVFLTGLNGSECTWETTEFDGAAAIIGSGAGTTYALLEL